MTIKDCYEKFYFIHFICFHSAGSSAIPVVHVENGIRSYNIAWNQKKK